METMVASSIATVVMLALVGMFLFCQRMFRLTMAEAESTLAMRELRDKLLFKGRIHQLRRILCVIKSSNPFHDLHHFPPD